MLPLVLLHSTVPHGRGVHLFFHEFAMALQTAAGGKLKNVVVQDQGEEL